MYVSGRFRHREIKSTLHFTSLLTNRCVKGEVAEWPIVPDSKSGGGATRPGVRIPPSPPFQLRIADLRLQIVWSSHQSSPRLYPAGKRHKRSSFRMLFGNRKAQSAIANRQSRRWFSRNLIYPLCFCCNRHLPRARCL